MTDYNSPEKLYHGLTIDRFIEHWQNGQIRGLSKFHLDPQGKDLGTWFSDQFQYPIEHRHGVENSDDILIDSDWSDIGIGRITEYKKKTRIVVELESVPDKKSLISHILPHQFFYLGNIPVSHLGRIHVDQLDDNYRERDISRLVSEGVPVSLIGVYDRFKKETSSYNPSK